MKKRNLAKEKFNRQLIVLVLYIVCIVTLTSMFIGFITDRNKTIFGYTARVVVSGSMEPNIKINSLNIIKQCDISDINIDDVICFNYSQDIVHRVVKKTTNDDGYIILNTKGDANANVDSIEINNDMIIGKVVYTFNGIASIIDKYSISPGQIDVASLTRNIVLNCLLIALVVILMFWVVSIIGIIVKAFSRKDNFNKIIDKYISDIDELILYRELLIDIKNSIVTNTSDTRFIYIGNRVAKAKAEYEIRNLHYNIKDFKKSIKHCLYFNRLGQVIDKNDSKKSIGDIVKYCKNFNKEN